MASILWDQVGSRLYENGLDRGVLYLPDGSAVPWNGLTAVIENFDNSTEAVYFDGMKVNDLVVLGDFSASLKAITYPDEFIELEGLGVVREGLFVADQRPQTFALCYRTHIGNDVNGDSLGYKIHILYNVTAIPSAQTYASFTTDPSLTEFEWVLTAVPQEVPGFRPTAHIILDSRKIDPWMLEEMELMLYGDSFNDASLLTFADLVTYMQGWFRVQIIDNGDGTWTAISQRDGFITFLGVEEFMIEHVNAFYLDADTFQISDTTTSADVPQLVIEMIAEGVWTATTEQNGIIVEISPGIVELRDANISYISADEYIIESTVI
jgi:hypothetical protein